MGVGERCFFLLVLGSGFAGYRYCDILRTTGGYFVCFKSALFLLGVVFGGFFLVGVGLEFMGEEFRMLVFSLFLIFDTLLLS